MSFPAELTCFFGLNVHMPFSKAKKVSWLALKYLYKKLQPFFFTISYWVFKKYTT